MYVCVSLKLLNNTILFFIPVMFTLLKYKFILQFKLFGSLRFVYVLERSLLSSPIRHLFEQKYSKKKKKVNTK